VGEYPERDGMFDLEDRAVAFSSRNVPLQILIAQGIDACLEQPTLLIS
jgi:hypothetical protein